MTTLTQSRKEELFNSVVPLINKAARSSYNGYSCAEASVPFEEIQQQAYLIAWGSLDLWDPSKAKWTTYVYNRVRFKLTHWHRKRVSLNGGLNYQKSVFGDLQLTDEYLDAGSDASIDALSFTDLERKAIAWLTNHDSRSWSSARRYVKRMAADLGVELEAATDIIDTLEERLGGE